MKKPKVKEELGDEYNVYISKIHLCSHCGQIIIVHKDTVKIYCPDCKKYTQIIPNK